MNKIELIRGFAQDRKLRVLGEHHEVTHANILEVTETTIFLAPVRPTYKIRSLNKILDGIQEGLPDLDKAVFVMQEVRGYGSIRLGFLYGQSEPDRVVTGPDNIEQERHRKLVVARLYPTSALAVNAAKAAENGDYNEAGNIYRVTKSDQSKFWESNLRR